GSRDRRTRRRAVQALRGKHVPAMNSHDQLPEFSQGQVAAQLRALGVKPGGVLLVHTSFRAVRPVEGGPAGLIAALRDALGPAGTRVMPTWCASADEPFAPKTTRAAPDLGVLADLFWRLPGVLRTEHLFAFAAVG